MELWFEINDKLERFKSQIEKIVTKEFRRRARFGKYSRFLTYASIERICYHLIYMNDLVFQLEENNAFADWVAQYTAWEESSPKLEPADVLLEDYVKEILHNLSRDIWLGRDNLIEDEEGNSVPFHTTWGIAMGNMTSHLDWCIENVTCESAVFGMMWCDEQLSVHWSGLAPFEKCSNHRVLELVSNIYHFYSGRRQAKYRLGGVFYDCHDENFKPFVYNEEERPLEFD
jgi:hypothetical protein